jgi:signal transduction histidine kinase
MSATPSPVRDSRATRGGYWIEEVWAVFAVGNLLAMWALRGSETIPFHFIYLSLAIVYGFRVWSLKPTLLLLGAVSLSTGAILIARYWQGVLSIDECAEIVLMPLIFAGQVWHAERRLAAQRELERMAEHERYLVQRQREFLRDVSHAVRTPLTIARGHLELIRADAVLPSVIEDADVILHQLERLANMASRLLTLEQLEGPEALAPVATDFSAMASRLVTRWAVSVPARRWEVDAVATGMVTVDVERLELAIDALMENAVKFTELGDTIRLRCWPADGWCMAEVSDTGSGVETEDLPFLFDRFWKRTRPGVRPGHGLGLSVVRAIVEAHGGEVAAGRNPDGGATFTLSIPSEPANQRAAVAVP